MGDGVLVYIHKVVIDRREALQFSENVLFSARFTRTLSQRRTNYYKGNNTYT